MAEVCADETGEGAAATAVAAGGGCTGSTWGERVSEASATLVDSVVSVRFHISAISDHDRRGFSESGRRSIELDSGGYRWPMPRGVRGAPGGR